MKAFAGAMIGLIAGMVSFLVINYQDILMVGRGEASLLMTYQLNQSVETYLFGGMIVGAIIGLSRK